MCIVQSYVQFVHYRSICAGKEKNGTQNRGDRLRSVSSAASSRATVEGRGASRSPSQVSRCAGLSYAAPRTGGANRRAAKSRLGLHVCESNGGPGEYTGDSPDIKR